MISTAVIMQSLYKTNTNSNDSKKLVIAFEA
jgi:hypothetical protein